MTRLLCLALALTCCACAGDRTGRARHTVVLRVAEPGTAGELDAYARAVRRLSGGTLQIRLEEPRRGPYIVPERDIIAGVRSGRFDLAVVGARAWDAEGAPSFEALGAPLLLDSFALEGAVLRRGVTAPMLRSLAPLGYTGIAVLPGPLRRPFGVTRPLVTLRDYRGARMGTFESRVSEATMRALGATPVDVPVLGPIAGLDGLEIQVGSIQGNRYDAGGGYVTANVALSARPLVLFGSARRYAELTAGQRRILARAAADALPSELGALASDDREAAGDLCRNGRIRLVTGDVAALRRAVAPVYGRLERDPATRAALRQIEQVKRRVGVPANSVAACAPSAPVRATAATPFDGVYRMVSSLRRDSARDPDPRLENYGEWIFVFSRGRFAFTQRYEGACTWGYGTYTVAGDRVEWRFTDGGGIAPTGATNKPGEDFVFRWNRYRDTLTMRPAPGAISPSNFFAEPWRRIASAPTRRFFARRCPPPAGALP